MNKNDSYLYYDTTAQDWLPATLEDLLRKNDPTLNICRLNPDGTPGDPITYKELLHTLPKPTAPTAAQQAASTEAILKHLSAIRFGIALLIAYMAFRSTEYSPLTTFFYAYIVASVIYFLLGIEMRFGRKKK